jgi:hypothetical protein
MPRTKILEPLIQNECTDIPEASLKHKYKQIFSMLKDMEMGIDISFNEFLQSLDLDEQTYILVFKSHLTKPQVFLKRLPSNIRTNAFNKKISHIWYANTDIQFILDPYAAATYCTSYMTNVDKSITSELSSIIKTCVTEKIDANTRILKLGNAFLNAQQMLAQLAIYLVLSLPLYHASRTFEFINTSPYNERAFVLKP